MTKPKRQQWKDPSLALKYGRLWHSGTHRTSERWIDVECGAPDGTTNVETSVSGLMRLERQHNICFGTNQPDVSLYVRIKWRKDKLIRKSFIKRWTLDNYIYHSLVSSLYWCVRSVRKVHAPDSLGLCLQTDISVKWIYYYEIIDKLVEKILINFLPSRTHLR